MPITGLATVKLRGFDELRRRHLRVGVLCDPGDLVPVEPSVEPHAEPPAMADVRRYEEALGIRVHQHVLHPLGSGAPEREPAVAVEIRQHHYEGALSANEEGRRAVAQALTRLRQSQADRAKPREDALAFTRPDHRLMVTEIDDQARRRGRGPDAEVDLVLEPDRPAQYGLEIARPSQLLHDRGPGARAGDAFRSLVDHHAFVGPQVETGCGLHPDEHDRTALHLDRIS